MAAWQSDPRRLPPPGLWVRVAVDSLVHRSGLLIAGGSPFRVVTLTAKGQERLASWQSGDRVGDDEAARQLARRLLDCGLLYPDPAPSTHLRDLAVIVPVRHTVNQLRRCLAALRDQGGPELELVVVDDGSDDATAIADVAAFHGARVLRHDEPRNAAAARNTGLAMTTQPLVAFVDADVVITHGALHRMVAQFSDGTVAGVAPRVCGLSERGVIGGYEARHSSLDMGPDPAPVAPNSAVPYVPSATLLVRRSALDAVGLFDEKLYIGEDVDLVWRLGGAGYRLIYDPSATVLHDHRVELRPFLQRRWIYAGSIGLLSDKHPDVLYAFRTDPALAAALGCGVFGRFRPAVALAALRALLLTYVLAGTDALAPWLVLKITRRMILGTVRAAGHAARRSWSPFLLLSRRGRRLLIAAFAVRVLEPRGPRNPIEIGLTVVDDFVAALATTASCLRHRTARPLLVKLSSVGSLWAKPRRDKACPDEGPATPAA